jgi:hypothetical protein
MIARPKPASRRIQHDFRRLARPMLLHRIMTELDSSILETIVGGASDYDRAYYRALGQEDNRCRLLSSSLFGFGQGYKDCMVGAEDRARARATSGSD